MNLFTTEQVSKYHPDKYADQISDSIVALVMTKNKMARCNVETIVKKDIVIIAGEIGKVNLSDDEIENAVRRVSSQLNYNFNKLINLLNTQSKQINNDFEHYAIGFAIRETDSYLPYAFELANKIIDQIDKSVKKHDVFSGETKTQVIVDLASRQVKKVLVSVCHNKKYSLNFVKHIIKNMLRFLVEPHHLIINPTGELPNINLNTNWGITGRKSVCDQYGGFITVVDGELSGKDINTISRFGTYAARNIAIDVLKVFKKLDWVEIQLSVKYDLLQPMSLSVKSNYFLDDFKIIEFINKYYDLRPKSLIEKLDLKPEDFVLLSQGSHFRNGYVGNWYSTEIDDHIYGGNK